MLCDRLVNAAEVPVGTPHESVELEWWELQRRALRVRGRTGNTIGILLPLGTYLFDGAVVTDATFSIAVRVSLRPCKVLVIHPQNSSELANVALELGNLHAPSEIVGDGIRTVIDGPVEALIREMGLRAETQTVKFNPRRCVGMPEVTVASNLLVRS